MRSPSAHRRTTTRCIAHLTATEHLEALRKLLHALVGDTQVAWVQKHLHVVHMASLEGEGVTELESAATRVGRRGCRFRRTTRSFTIRWRTWSGHFVTQQVNKVNRRKEFFRLKLQEIRKFAEERGLQATWTMSAACREWKETLALEKSMSVGHTNVSEESGAARTRSVRAAGRILARRRNGMTNLIETHTRRRRSCRRCRFGFRLGHRRSCLRGSRPRRGACRRPRGQGRSQSCLRLRCCSL